MFMNSFSMRKLADHKRKYTMGKKDKEEVKEKKDTSPKFISPCGLDVGTMNLVSAFLENPNDKPSKSLTRRIRNNYLHLDNPEDFDVQRYSHVVIEGETYILGEDAFKLGNVFNKEVSRCMKAGLIAAGELEGMDVVSAMIQSLIGKGDGTKKCVYSVPADPIDKTIDNKYHEQFFGRVLSHLGWIPHPMNEALAVAYSELENDDMTGIAISFGAGMSNICIAYQGVVVEQFSVAIGGDWIDTSSANMANVATNRITALKEKPEFSIINPMHNKKDIRRRMEIIADYYKAMISQVGSHIQQRFGNVTAQFPDEIPIVISGGTSMANGFVQAMEEILSEYEYPFDISEIRQAKDPMYAVARGCLIAALKK